MCDYLDYQDFFELESFDESCPCCGSTDVQEIDRWIGDDFDDFGLENVRHTSCYISFLQRIQAKAR